MSENQLVWLITGTSSGFGKELTLEALRRGDKVIATARNVARVDSSLRENGADVLRLDVTDTLSNLKEIASRAVAIHDRVDVLINNAGYVLFGAIEENSPEESLSEFNTNVLGALNVTRAFLPYMRERKSGRVFYIGSIAGWVGVPGAGLYCATKAALRGMVPEAALASAVILNPTPVNAGVTLAMHEEVKHLGIKVHCIEPGYFRTPLLSTNGHRTTSEERIPDYNPIIKPSNDRLVQYDMKQPGNPAKLVEVVVDIGRGEGIAEVVLVYRGKYEGRLAVIADIIDQNRAVCDGPTTGVPRQIIAYRDLILTPLLIKKLNRGTGTRVIRQRFTEDKISEKWEASKMAQRRAALAKRRELNDFGRFEVTRLKRKRREVVNHASRKLKNSEKSS
ncbi:hypothetical protein FRB99_004640 [Tulasnella sp. 403]|nr:hypothetical protein FRB99_004640 [Tulasnella sp. 403]